MFLNVTAEFNFGRFKINLMINTLGKRIRMCKNCLHDKFFLETFTEIVESGLKAKTKIISFGRFLLEKP